MLELNTLFDSSPSPRCSALQKLVKSQFSPEKALESNLLHQINKRAVNLLEGLNTLLLLSRLILLLAQKV